MSAYEVLAVIGGITGPAAASAEVWSIWRDRPSLKLDFGVRTFASAPPQVWLGILNDGRQPVTVREAGFYGSQMPIEIDSQDHGKLHGTAAYTYKLVKNPVLFDPGHYEEFEAAPPDAVNVGYHVDFPLRAYVLDARRKRVWSSAAPVTRMAYGHGSCPAGFPAYLWDPTDKPLRPARVAPRWKLWVRRELRRGDLGRPSGDELIRATGHADDPSDPGDPGDPGQGTSGGTSPSGSDVT